MGRGEPWSALLGAVNFTTGDEKVPGSSRVGSLIFTRFLIVLELFEDILVGVNQG